MTDEADTKQDADESVDLKDPALAAFLAWLIPGLGHLYQRRYAKSALFFICIMGLFVYGLYLGGSSKLGWGRVVYVSWRTANYSYSDNQHGNSWQIKDNRLPYLCQIGIGLPAMPALVQAHRMRSGKEVLGGDGFWKGFMAPPRIPNPNKGLRKDDPAWNNPDQNVPNSDQPTAHTLHYQLGRYFELGTVYTMIAGLLNILAIYDAAAGPVITETARKEDEDEDKDADEDDETKEEDAAKIA